MNVRSNWSRCRRSRMAVLLLPVWLSAVLPAWAQAQSRAQNQGRAQDGESPLAIKQAIIRDRVLNLQDLMFRLIDQLEESEPKLAKRLKKTLEHMGELQLRQDLDQLVLLLNNDTSLGRAVDRQGELVNELAEVLKLLMTDEEDKSLEKRKKELEDAIKALDELIGKEKDLKQDSDQAAKQQGQMKVDPEAAAALKALIKQQAQLMQFTEARRQGKNPAKGEELAQNQKALEKMAQDIAKMLEEKGEEDAASAAESSSELMQEAAEDLKNEDFGMATDSQAEALADLQRALNKLSKKAADGAQAPETSEMAKEQDKVGEETAEVAEQMAGDPDDPESEPIPGREHVGHAQKQMGSASRQLEQQSPGEASKSQKKAIDELQKAKAEVEQALRELKEQEQEQKREKLRQMLAQMLTRQQGVSRATFELDQIPRNEWQRAESLRAVRQGQSERELSDSAKECLKIVEEDGTTAVFPYLLEGLRDDLLATADWLNDGDVGARTQLRQREIEQTLEDLLDIIEQTQNDSNEGDGDQQQQQQQQQQPDPPLLPTSAELELLARMQERVFSRTRMRDRMRVPLEADEATRLADQQQEIAEMTGKLDRKLRQQQ